MFTEKLRMRRTTILRTATAGLIDGLDHQWISMRTDEVGIKISVARVTIRCINRADIYWQYKRFQIWDFLILKIIKYW